MTWEAREFRILLALGRLEGNRPPGADVDAHEIAQDAGLDTDQTIAGILALRDGAFLDAESLNAGDGRIMAIHGIKLLPAGRRAIGQWPSPDSIEAKRAKRLMFMRHLYEVTGGSRLEARPAHSLGSGLGMVS